MNIENYKKLLILAYDFPPYVSVGGLRPYAWYKYLKEFGVYPIVVTRQWGNRYGNHLDYIAPGDSSETIVEETEYGTIIRTPYKPNLANRLMLKYGDNKWVWLRKLITAYYEFVQWFLLVGPKVNLYYGAKEFLKTNKVDAIIATGDPFILFRYANLLGKNFNIPWVADYRDDWIDIRPVKEKNVLLYFLKKIIESKVISKTKKVLTVSNYHSKVIGSRIKKSVFSLENGVDLALYKNCKSPYNIRDFIILYTGTLYDLPYLQDFIDGFTAFIEKNNNNNIKLIFIGIEKNKNQATNLVYKLSSKYYDKVFIEKQKNSSDITKYQVHAHVLLNFIAGDPRQGMIGAKSYSYAAARKPILTIPYIKTKETHFFPDRDIHFVATSSNEIFHFLDNIFDRFIKKKPILNSITNIELESISTRYMSLKLKNFLFHGD